MQSLHAIEEMDSFLQTETITLLYISQPNCSVCHALLPQVEELLEEYPDIQARHMDASEVPEIAGRLSVMTVPAVLVFVEGKEMFRKARFVPMGELNQQLAKLNHFINE
ncbi:thioredoxin family protein [Halobacillus salinus]|uniref:Thioredoxin n=1 Tax=Halobacillus salinus TaxID=192814 RepID=A0A4Z0H3N5_9BACI|nr:thioredoxin family protein [Halobacillus salinus]TGB03876.1 thioredoxin [Halobacillus salinus]